MVEAAISLPIFILVFVALALVVNIIASCEEMVFKESRLVYDMDMKAPQIIPNPRKEGYKVVDFDYLYSSSWTDDLISLDTRKDFEVENPIGILGKIRFRLDILSRGFTGQRQREGPLGEEEFCDGAPSEKVIVFPKYGIRFHKEGCRYVKMDFEGEEEKLVMEKRDAEMKGFSPCTVCGG